MGHRGKRLLQDHGIDDRDLVVQVVLRGSAEALDDALLRAVGPGVRVSRSPHRDVPHPGIDRNRIDNQRISLPMPPRVPIEADIGIPGMWTPIGRYPANGLGELSQNPYHARQVNNLYGAVFSGLRRDRGGSTSRRASTIWGGILVLVLRLGPEDGWFLRRFLGIVLAL